MTDTRKVLEAASALSHALRERGVGHAFHGGIIPAVLAQSPLTYDVVCIVEGGQWHPFRRVRDALAGNTMFTVIQSTWTNRLHVRYLLCTPMIELEILPAGEFGPRILNSTTCMRISGLPYLSISEFVRAKLKLWMISGVERDAQDICFAVTNYWARVDFNRVPENDMVQFVLRYPSVAQAWEAIRRKYNA